MKKARAIAAASARSVSTAPTRALRWAAPAASSRVFVTPVTSVSVISSYGA